MTTWQGLLVLLFALVLCFGLGRLTRRERTRLGIDSGTIVGADDSHWPAPTLFSARLGLVARPDHLLRSGSYIIPVEQKPRARHAQPSHVMQLGTQCILVEDVYGKRLPYGVLVLADGVQVRVPFTPALEQRVLKVVGEMRDLLRRGGEPGPEWVGAKCRACGFRQRCWE